MTDEKLTKALRFARQQAADAADAQRRNEARKPSPGCFCHLCMSPSPEPDAFWDSGSPIGDEPAHKTCVAAVQNERKRDRGRPDAQPAKPDPYLGSKIGCDCNAVGNDDHWYSCPLSRRGERATGTPGSTGDASMRRAEGAIPSGPITSELHNASADDVTRARDWLRQHVSHLVPLDTIFSLATLLASRRTGADEAADSVGKATEGRGE